MSLEQVPGLDLGRKLMRVKLGRGGEQIQKKKSGHLGFVLYSFFRAVRAFRVVLAFFGYFY